MVNKGWLVVLGSVLGLTVGAGSVKIFAVSILLKPTAEALGVERSTVSLAYLIGSIAGILCTPFYGRMIDVHGIRAVSIPLIVGWAVSMALFSVLAADNGWLLYPLYIAVGVFSIAQTPLPYSKAVVSWFNAKRGLALGIAVSGVGLGGFLLPHYAQFILARYGWRMTYVGLGAAVLVAVPVMALLIRQAPGSPGLPRQIQSRQAARADLVEAISQGRFWSLSFIFLFAVIAINGVLGNMAALLTDRGLSGGFAASALSMAGGSVILGRVVCGYLLDRFHGPYVASALFLVPMASCVALLLSSSQLPLLLAALGIGAGIGAEVDILGYLTSRYFKLSSYGTVYGILWTFVAAGTSFGPFAMNLLYRRAGNYDTALALAAAILAASAVLSLFLGRYPEFEEVRSGISRDTEPAPV